MNLFQTYETSDKSRREFIHRCKPQKMRYVLDYDLSLCFGRYSMSLRKEDTYIFDPLNDYFNLDEIRDTFHSLILSLLSSASEVNFINRDENDLMLYLVNKKYLLEYNNYNMSIAKGYVMNSEGRLLSKDEVDDLIWDVSVKLNEIWEEV